MPKPAKAPGEQPVASLTNMEVEQALLGAIMINNEAFHHVSSVVSAEDFGFQQHQQIFAVCAQLITAGKHATPITVKQFIDDDQEWAGMPPRKYLARLCAEATTIINAYDYATTIRDLADLRRIASIGDQMGAVGHVDPVQIASQAIDQLDAIVTRHFESASPTVTMREAVARAVKAAGDAYQSNGALTGLPWGWVDLDAKTLGLHRSELTIMAGRPGMGKTAVALCAARTMGLAGNKGAIFSLEMPDIPLTQRMLADQLYDGGHIPYWELRSGKFHERDYGRVVDAGEALANLPITIDQQAGISISQIGMRSRNIKRRSGLDFIIVDHIQLARASERYSGNRPLELGEITSGLKTLAKDLGIAVLALCQLSRGVEGREDKRPTLADLKWSGDIEQDADTVIMLFREAYYLERREPPSGPGSPAYDAWRVAIEKASNKLEAIIEKQRNGPVGSVQLFFDIACNAVRNMTRDAQLPLDDMGGFR
jgi:replicative DNA helicase